MQTFPYIKTRIKSIYNKIYNRWISVKYKGILYNQADLYNICIVNHGVGNRIIIKKGSILTDCRFVFWGSNCIVTINENCSVKSVEFFLEDNNSSIEVGKECSFEGETQLAACESRKILIGEDCMFSHEISIRTTDSHSIIDNVGLRINQAADVILGNHVWVGIQSYILKGSEVGNNVIIAARSTVTSSSPNNKNIILAGSPAKIIKNNVNWLRARI